MQSLRRYLDEKEPTFKNFAKVALQLGRRESRLWVTRPSRRPGRVATCAHQAHDATAEGELRRRVAWGERALQISRDAGVQLPEPEKAKAATA